VILWAPLLSCRPSKLYEWECKQAVVVPKYTCNVYTHLHVVSTWFIVGGPRRGGGVSSSVITGRMLKKSSLAKASFKFVWNVLGLTSCMICRGKVHGGV
jgi:hypothetical protein